MRPATTSGARTLKLRFLFIHHPDESGNTYEHRFRRDLLLMGANTKGNFSRPPAVMRATSLDVYNKLSIMAIPSAFAGPSRYHGANNPYRAVQVQVYHLLDRPSEAFQRVYGTTEVMSEAKWQNLHDFYADEKELSLGIIFQRGESCIHSRICEYRGQGLLFAEGPGQSFFLCQSRAAH